MALVAAYLDARVILVGAVTDIVFAWHWRGPHILNIVVLAVADGLFGLCP